MPDKVTSTTGNVDVDMVNRLAQAGAAQPAVNRTAVSGGRGRFDAAGQPGTADGLTGADGLMPQPEVKSPDSMLLMLTEISNKMSAERMKSTETAIKGRMADKKQKNEETIKKLQEAMAAKSSAKVGDIIGKVFSWVAVALLFVVAAVVAVVSGGAAAAPLFAAALITAAVLIVVQSGAIDKAMEGADPGAKIAVNVLIAVMLLLINIAAAIMSGGAGSAGVASSVTEIASSTGEIAAESAATAAETAAETAATSAEVAAETASTAAETAAETAATAAETAAETASTAAETGAETTATAAETGAETSAEAAESTVKTTTDTAKAATKAGKMVAKLSEKAAKYGNKIKGGTQMLSGAVGVGSGVAGITTTAYGYEASQAQAESKEIKAQIAKLDALNEQDMETLRKILSQLQDQVSNTTMMLAESTRTTKRIFTSV